MDENRSSSTTQSITNAAQTGAKIAKTTKNTAKAIGKAATGNVAGAAIDILKDDTWRQVIIIILVIHFFAIFVALFVFPMSLYEGVKTFWEDKADTWAENYYGEHGRFASFFIALGKTISKVFQDIWAEITSASTGEEDSDRYSEKEFDLISDESELNQVYGRKVQAAKDKVTGRQNQIAKIIENDAKPGGRISDYFAGRFASEYPQQDQITYSGEYDDEYNQLLESIVTYTYDGVTTYINKKTLKDTEALRLLCLHTVQEGGDINNVKLSAFMKWMGYNGGRNKNLTFPLGQNKDFTYTTKSWTGTFMPQYLEDENSRRVLAKIQDPDSTDNIKKDDYDKNYGAPLVDMLIKIECPPLSTIRASVTEEIRTEQAQRSVLDSRTYYYYDDDGNSYQYEVNYTDGMSGWSDGMGPEGEYHYSGSYYESYHQEDYDFQHTYYHVKYMLIVNINCRSVDKILDITGLWKGLLPREETSASVSDLEEAG